MQVTDLALQFHDGVYLILLLGSLGDFYVPMNQYHLTPISDAMKVQNAEVCLQLLEKMGLSRNGINARGKSGRFRRSWAIVCSPCC